jgi:hypothetical protein
MSLADFRAKRGLPPAIFHDPRSPLERVVARYRRFDLCRDSKAAPIAALRVLASSCAKAIVAWAEQAGQPVDDAARFQFFAAGAFGQELLQVRVSRLGPPKGPWKALEFKVDCETLLVAPASALEGNDEVFKPLLTIPMSGFYRLR